MHASACLLPPAQVMKRLLPFFVLLAVIFAGFGLSFIILQVLSSMMLLACYQPGQPGSHVITFLH
jgi:hypothetical protein